MGIPMGLIDSTGLTYYAVLGDGNIDAERRVIELNIGSEKYELWSEIINRIMRHDFKEHDLKTAKAVDIDKRRLGDSIIRALIDYLN